MHDHSLGEWKDSTVGTVSVYVCVCVCVCVYMCERHKERDHFSQSQNEVGELDRTLSFPPMKVALSYSQEDIWGVKRKPSGDDRGRGMLASPKR